MDKAIKISKNDLELAARGFASFGGEFVGFDKDSKTVLVKFDSTEKMMVLISELKKIPRYRHHLRINSRIIDEVQHLTITPQ